MDLVLGHKLEDYLYFGNYHKSGNMDDRRNIEKSGLALKEGLSFFNSHLRLWRPLLPFSMVS
jgi:hypothetical protein